LKVFIEDREGGDRSKRTHIKKKLKEGGNRPSRKILHGLSSGHKDKWGSSGMLFVLQNKRRAAGNPENGLGLWVVPTHYNQPAKIEAKWRGQ